MPGASTHFNHGTGVYGFGKEGEGHNLARKTERVEVELERSEINSAQLVNPSTSRRGDRVPPPLSESFQLQRNVRSFQKIWGTF